MQAMEHGIDVFTGYGMSETCPILTLAQLQPHMLDWPADRQAEIRCKTGRPVPFVQIRLVDTDMNDVPDDGVVAGRDRRARAVADGRVPEGPRQLGDAVGRRLAAHRRHRGARSPTDTCGSPTG